MRKRTSSGDRFQDAFQKVKERPAAAEAKVADAKRREAEKLKGDIDDLLDEIDDVLETNAEDFVKSYIQKGGE